MSRELATLEEKLKSQGHSMTTVRKTVFMSLLDKEPQTMAEIANSLKDTVDRASVYRSIALFEELGIVERLQLGWKYKIELSDSFAAHHHHITCTSCGRVQAFEESSVIEFELKQLANEAGFLETGHQVEIRGICTQCQDSSAHT